MTLLGSGLFGVVFVAREFSSHSIARLFYSRTHVGVYSGRKRWYVR